MEDLRHRNRVWRRALRIRLKQWEGAFVADTQDDYFQDHERMPSFDWSRETFSPTTAWWLAELCRLVYTPDHREAPRDRKGKLPRRHPILDERTPFEEVHSVHKTGNHASIYRCRDGESGTIVCFRGSSKLRQWIMNALIRPHGWRRFRLEGDPTDGFVHSGFYVFHKRIWPRIAPQLEELPRPWIFTGHSLGGALATIAGVIERPDLVCTFGAPKLGNESFLELVDRSRTWRIVNDTDLVPRLPLPDTRLGERILRHGGPAIRLVEAGSWDSDYERSEEDRLPFQPSSLHREFTGPPTWLTSHRMVEYCRRLRNIVLEGDPETSHPGRLSD